MTTRYAAGPGAGITPAAPALPPDPFAPRPWLRGRGGRRLSGRPAVFVLASLIVALLASSAAPTPLYAIYQAQWHFTPITTTVVFGVYALAVLASLLTLGKLSDHVGRRPVPLTGLAGDLRHRDRGACAPGCPGGPGPVYRRGPGRDRRGHAGHGPRARHLRQRGGAGHGQRDRRDPLRAGGPLPARPHPPHLPRPH